MSITGQTVIVTGAASGIGRATAERLARAGARVAIADVDATSAASVAASLEGAIAVSVDVTDTASVRAMVATVVAELGSIDVLVNNAGWDRIAPFMDTDEALWDKILEINLKGQIACAHAVLPTMVERGGGRIVCVASDAGRVGSTGEVVYSAAKGGVIAFAKALAREVARHRIKVNVIAPGPTETPFLERFTEDGRDGILDAMVKATPLRRLARPEDIASAVAFFVSEDSDFITGQTLSVSGGLTMA
jgi:2-hydroxycyclohexanecarboxyl-CoA dehydrogenase